MTDSLADIKEKLKDNEEIQQLDLTKINAEINKDKAGEESEQAVHKMDHYFSDF
jgi:fatty acid-binding protein DegV